MAASKFTYKFTGDTVKVFRGQLIRPGGAIGADDELINGEFEPTNPAAKAAKAATDKANDEAGQEAEAQRLEAMNGSLHFPEVASDFAAAIPAPAPAAAAAAPAADAPATTSSAAPAAPEG